MKKSKKKAQFFLLAAIIISAIILSLDLVANEVKTSNPPEDIYDYSFNVKQETGAVIDSIIFSNFQDDANLDNFVDLLAKNIYDNNPDLNFLFIYGNHSKITLRNFGTNKILTSAGQIGGINKGITSTIRFGGTSIEVTEPVERYNVKTGQIINNSEIDIELNGYNFSFPFSENKQVVFVVQKEENNETYIYID